MKSKFLYNGLIEVIDDGTIFIHKNGMRKEYKYHLSGGE